MPRSRRWWRDRLRLAAVTLAGILLGILVGAILVHVIQGQWGDF